MKDITTDVSALEPHRQASLFGEPPAVDAPRALPDWVGKQRKRGPKGPALFGGEVAPPRGKVKTRRKQGSLDGFSGVEAEARAGWQVDPSSPDALDRVIAFGRARLGVVPTDEQAHSVLGAARDDKVKIVSLAGTGKTELLRMIGEASPGRGVYIAFNKTVQVEAEARFPTHMRCRTAHSLAFQAVGRSYKAVKDYRTPAPHEIMRFMGWGGEDGFRRGWMVREALNSYLNSDAVEPVPESVPRMVRALIDASLKERGLAGERYDAAMSEEVWSITQWVRDVWDGVVSTTERYLPMPHDGYLKLWSMRKPRILTDFILLDEAQDASPVIRSIVAAQKARLILVGDRNQQIYAFRGAVDALDEMEAAEYALTGSFRFGEKIAEAANAVLGLKGESMRLKGLGPADGFVGDFDESQPFTVLCRTNAEVLKYCIANVRRKQVAVVGGMEDLFTLAMSTFLLWKGEVKRVKAAMLRPFRSWAEFVRVAESLKDPEMRMLVRLIGEHGDSLPIVLEEVRSRLVEERHANLTLSTTHKAKGREWNCVQLADDFRLPYDPEGALDIRDEEMNLLYVAATRARRALKPNLALRMCIDPPPKIEIGRVFDDPGFGQAEDGLAPDGLPE
jgi:hypothetical protein